MTFPCLLSAGILSVLNHAPPYLLLSLLSINYTCFPKLLLSACFLLYSLEILSIPTALITINNLNSAKYLLPESQTYSINFLTVLKEQPIITFNVTYPKLNSPLLPLLPDPEVKCIINGVDQLRTRKTGMTMASIKVHACESHLNLKQRHQTALH